MHINQPKSPPDCRDSVSGFRGKHVVIRQPLYRYWAKAIACLWQKAYCFGVFTTLRLGLHDATSGAEKAGLFVGTVPSHAHTYALVADKKSKHNASPTRYLKVCRRTHIRYGTIVRRHTLRYLARLHSSFQVLFRIQKTTPSNILKTF